MIDQFNPHDFACWVDSLDETEKRDVIYSMSFCLSGRQAREVVGMYKYRKEHKKEASDL